MPLVALASFNLWVTIPHHYATWVRTYGLAEDWARWKARLVAGPLAIVGLTVSGLIWAPMATALLVAAWDHQHSVMQQHGFARIYDFKAGSGAPSTRRIDLWLNVVLYVNLILTAPLWVGTWYGEFGRWGAPIAVATVRQVSMISWSLTAVFGVAYLVHVVWCLRNGYGLNPIKYLFLASSYFLWYYASWHTNSLLVFGVAHRIMHGVQYMVMVYWYMERKERRARKRLGLLSKVSVGRFLLFAVVYAVLFQVIGGFPLSYLGFGVTDLFQSYAQPVSPTRAYDIYAATLLNATAALHYYVDSFIWKVRDPRTQEGL